MRIVPFAQVPAASWDALAEESDDAWLMHRRAWVEIESEFFVARNLSFAVVDGDIVLAIQPLYLSGPAQGTSGCERLVHSGIHRHCGPGVRAGIAPGKRAAIERQAVSHAVQLACALGADRIQLGSHTLSPRNRERRNDLVPIWAREFGFELGIGFGPEGIVPAPGFATLAADQHVDLRRPAEEIFEGLDEACRRAVRKARKAGLAARVSSTVDDLDRYWRLACLSAERTGESLPSRDYYARLLGDFGLDGRAFMIFATKDDEDLAALFLLRDKGAVSFLAGVSDPSALALRPNDFVHWSAIEIAKAGGAEVYRLGPIFPSVPDDWPIARVSSFKGKFGASSVPMIVGSLHLNAERAAAQVRAAGSAMISTGALRTSLPPPAPSVHAELVAHRLRVTGVDAVAATDARAAAVLVVDAGAEGQWLAARRASASGTAVVVLRAWLAAPFLDGLRADPAGADRSRLPLTAVAGHRTLRVFHPTYRLSGAAGVPLVVDAAGDVVCCWLPGDRAGFLLVGTDLGRDLVLITQGDAGKARTTRGGGKWGFDNERPNYLFEDQIDAANPADRQADWWIWTLREALVAHGSVRAAPVLPEGAPGAVIVTGDDDQAAPADYAGQARRLGSLPVTYFLHPLARLDRAGLSAIGNGRVVEWELHPDALDTPGDYAERLAEQAAWYTGLVGRPPRSVRNHGFLNDGYWNHARSWLAHGITASSNLPGFDGCVLNGSLLPGRLALDGRLTPHWSLLTLFGDGVFFIHEWDGVTARAAVRRAADAIVSSGVPGIVVMNLHPANHERAAGMHDAAHDLVTQYGFAAMTLGAAIDWFSARERASPARPGEKMPTPAHAAPAATQLPGTAATPRHILGRLVGRASRALRALKSR